MHPLPDDVAPTSTVDIVKSIRCEALAGIESLNGEAKLRAAPIVKATAIGYDFTFTIDEDDQANGSNSPGNSFLQLASGSRVKADLEGNAQLHRQNTRRFTVIEPLGDMTNAENRAMCADRTNQANWAYPMTGTVGIDEVVRTYLKVEMLSELQLDKRPETKIPHIVFADDLTFTTELHAGATTELVLNAVVGQLKVTNASVHVGASRTDTHRVVVALTRKQIDVVEPRSAAVARSAAAAKRNRSDLVVDVHDPRTQARLIQVDEDARTSIAIELQRRRTLNDVDNVPAEALGQRFLDVLKLP